jgi:hypothetical protein
MQFLFELAFNNPCYSWNKIESSVRLDMKWDLMDQQTF